VYTAIATIAYNLLVNILRTLRARAATARNLALGKPILAIFEANLRCNSACGYCALPLNLGRPEMTRAQIFSMFEKLARNGMLFVFLQGGEPTLRDDIADILEDLCALGLFPVLITNGTRLTEVLVRRLARLRMHVSVSLDSLDRERYKHIRGADQLPRVLRGIDALSAFPGKKFITCILSDVNRNEVRGVVAFARSKGFTPIVGAYHWDVGPYGKADDSLRYDPALAIEVFRNVRDGGDVPAGYYRDYLDDTIRWLSGGSLLPCDAGRYSIAIDASGNVAPCLAQPAAGNANLEPVDDIVDRFDRAEIDRCSRASTCNLICSRVVGTAIRRPISGVRTVASFR